MARLAFLSASVAICVVGGCANPGTETPANARLADREVRGRVVEWIASGRRDAYSCALLAGARDAARELGVELLVHDSPGSSWKDQEQRLARRIGGERSEWPHALVLDPIAYVPPLILTVRSAHDRNLAVILVDEPEHSRFHPGSGPSYNPGFVWSFVSSDERAVGTTAAVELVRWLEGKPRGVLVVTTRRSHRNRRQGFVDALLANPGFSEPQHLHLDEESPEAGAKLIGDFLRTHPEIAGAFAADHVAALALARAKEALSSPLLVVAAEAEPGELELLRSGALQALIARPGFQVGATAVHVAAQAVVYRDPPTHEIPPPIVLTRLDTETLGERDCLDAMDRPQARFGTRKEQP